MVGESSDKSSRTQTNFVDPHLQTKKLFSDARDPDRGENNGISGEVTDTGCKHVQTDHVSPQRIRRRQNQQEIRIRIQSVTIKRAEPPSVGSVEEKFKTLYTCRVLVKMPVHTVSVPSCTAFAEKDLAFRAFCPATKL